MNKTENKKEGDRGNRRVSKFFKKAAILFALIILVILSFSIYLVATGNTNKRQGAAKIKVRGPRYLRGVHRGRGPNFREELQAISKRDGRILARTMDKRVTAELKKAGPRTKITR